MGIPSVPNPSPSNLLQAQRALTRKLGASRVLVEDEVRSAYAHDDSDMEGGLPDLVVIAHTREDIVAVLEIASRWEVPVTPRAGGTGRTGGAVPIAGGIVLSVHAMASIKEIDRHNRIAVVEPGVVTGDLHAAVEAEGLFYPPDPNSSAQCQLGGNVAENAAGPRALKYGVTRDYVLGLAVCLMGGRTLHTGRRTTKGVTGYDVTSLLVGSEGTLGVVSEVTVRLLPKPAAVATLLALFVDARASAVAVSSLLAEGEVPRCIELFDRETLQILRTHGVAVEAVAGAMLLVEVDGDPRAVEREVERVGGLLEGVPGALAVHVAHDRLARERLWAARRVLSSATRTLARHKLSEDVVVPCTQIPALLEEIDRIGVATGVRHLAYGHAGNGNLHVNFFWNEGEERPSVDRALAALMRTTLALGGTLSGEHGIGLSKAQYLPLEQSDDLIALQQGLKAVFDPQGLLNPGKIFPVRGHRGC